MTTVQGAPRTAKSVAAAFLASLARATRVRDPFDYWLLDTVLPVEDAEEITALPFAPPEAAAFDGRRETNNATRVFFNSENQARFAVCRRLSQAFDDPDVRGAISRETGADLADTRLRIEYCQDTEGFWLAPHTDIAVKKFTMLVYLSDDPRLKNAGTDIHEGPPRYDYVCSAPYGWNLGLIFIPGANTWHAVGRRSLHGAVRKSIIVNYVGPAWRDAFELA